MNNEESKDIYGRQYIFLVHANMCADGVKSVGLFIILPPKIIPLYNHTTIIHVQSEKTFVKI